MSKHKIYTHQGDEGYTYTANGLQVRKDNNLIEAIGTIDELNANIGLLIAITKGEKANTQILQTIQSDLFIIGALLSGSKADISQEWTTRSNDMEQEIDKLQDKIPPLNSFILPGGSVTGSTAHVCRTICRRAERRVTSIAENNEVAHKALIYFNRLGDLLFVLARYLSFIDGEEEKTWQIICKSHKK